MINQPDRDTSVYPPDAETVPVVVNQTNSSASGGGTSMERHREDYVQQDGSQVASQVEVYENKNAQRANLRYWLSTFIYFLLGVLEVILGLRFIFRLLGANEGNDFIMFLYNLSHVFVGPFNGIFNDQAIGTASVFEVSTLVAMLIYGLIAWGLVSLGRVVFAPDYSGERRVSTTWRR